jgi:hypothetical protein
MSKGRFVAIAVAVGMFVASPASAFPQAKTGYASVNGLDVSTRDPRSWPPVVLLHG